MPKLKIMDSPALNAFASGLNRRQYSITVTTGLAERAQRSGDRGGAGPRTDPHPQRRRADDGDRGDHRRRGRLLRRIVLPHVHQSVVEFHRRSSWSSSSSSLVLFVILVDSDSKSSGGGAVIVVIIAVALIVLAWLLSQVVKLALSRSREFLADAGSVELTKNPDAMISALRKIESRGELPGATSAVMELCVDNPREGFADLFATHPSVRRPASTGAGEIRRRPRSRPAGRCRAIPRTSRNRPRSPTSPPPPLPQPRTVEAMPDPRATPRPIRRAGGPWGRRS